MDVFVDTSAFYAFLDADDACHKTIAEAWSRALNEKMRLFTSNYVIVETLALVQNRLGMQAVNAFLDDVLPAAGVLFVDEALHAPAVSAMVAAGRRGLSFVDCVSFDVMRRSGIRSALTTDRHFEESGFIILC